MRRKTGISDEENVGGAGKSGSNDTCVSRSFASTKVKRFEATMGKPTIKSRGDGSDCVLEKRETLIQRS